MPDLQAVPEMQVTRVFYSYASEDAALFSEFEIHLRVLERNNLIQGWHRGLLHPGVDTHREITTHLN